MVEQLQCMKTYLDSNSCKVAPGILITISIMKFVLFISKLCKTDWSWELRTWSHKMKLLDFLSTSPHYFCRKWIKATMRIEILILRFKGLNRLFEMTQSPCTNVSKQTMQNIMMTPVEFSLENTGWKFSDTLNEFESFNWSKHNFGEIHISQGSDWAFHSLPHHSLLLALNGRSNLPSVNEPSCWSLLAKSTFLLSSFYLYSAKLIHACT